jgi:hypothetical protein
VAPMETGLQLLMRDGALRLMFHPHLSPDQYGELFETVREVETTDALAEAARLLAAKWGCELQVDSMLAQKFVNRWRRDNRE